MSYVIVRETLPITFFYTNNIWATLQLYDIAVILVKFTLHESVLKESVIYQGVASTVVWCDHMCSQLIQNGGESHPHTHIRTWALCGNLCLCAEVRKPGHHTRAWSGVTVSHTSRQYSSAICGGKKSILSLWSCSSVCFKWLKHWLPISLLLLKFPLL